MIELTQDQIACLARELIIVEEQGGDTATDKRKAMHDYIVRTLFNKDLEALCVRLQMHARRPVRSYEERVNKMSAEISRFLSGETANENWGERL
jgi:hypothetical protein